MNSVQKKKLHSILNDKVSGSSHLLIKINRLLLASLNDQKSIREIIGEIKKQLSHFTVLDNYIKDLTKILSKNNLKQLEKFLNNFHERNHSNKRIAEKLIKKIPGCKKIVTISRSKTFSDVIPIVDPDRKIKITILESRPANEGRITAIGLLKKGFRVTFITDAMMAFAVKNSDAVIIGADSILKNKNTVNKSGSLPLALLCKYYKKPFFVITTRSKFSNKKRFKVIREKSDAIWNYRNKNLEIINYPFEEIDSSLITDIISD